MFGVTVVYVGDSEIDGGTADSVDDVLAMVGLVRSEMCVNLVLASLYLIVKCHQ